MAQFACAAAMLYEIVRHVETVASNVFKLTFQNAGALQFLDNHFSSAVVGKLLAWAANFQRSVFLHRFYDVAYGVFPHGCLLVPHDGFWFSITPRYNGPVVFSSAGRFSEYFFNKATGHLFSPVANILGVASRDLTRSPPPLVFVRP